MPPYASVGRDDGQPLNPAGEPSYRATGPSHPEGAAATHEKALRQAGFEQSAVSQVPPELDDVELDDDEELLVDPPAPPPPVDPLDEVVLLEEELEDELLPLLLLEDELLELDDVPPPAPPAGRSNV